MSRRLLCAVLSILMFLGCVEVSAQEDKLQPGDRERARAMLNDTYDAVKSHYYDPKFHGIDLAARHKDAMDKIQQATSFNQMLGIIAWFMDGLDDSHTFFVPPERAYKLDYGWRVLMVGDRCFITEVRPGSDAEKQGVKRGDQVLAINGLKPTRDSLHKIQYAFNILRPQPGLRLVVESPDGKQRQLDLRAEIKATRREITNYSDYMDEVRDYERTATIYKRRSVQVNDIMIWKLPEFDMNEKGADAIVDDSKHDKTIILDLRGNPGGRADALERLVEDIFDHDVPIAKFVGRKKLNLKPEAKARNEFNGKIIVLIDSGSASASEIFARVIQLEKRGIVIGDRSAGAVMVAEDLLLEEGLPGFHSVDCGVSVTVAEMLMKDGTSLEKVGVEPDEVVLPTGSDLAANRDPAMARAVELAGGKMSPEEAGKLFPYEWAPF